MDTSSANHRVLGTHSRAFHHSMPKRTSQAADESGTGSVPENVIAIDAGGSILSLVREKHSGVPELSRRWGYSEDVIRKWFLEKPRLGVLRHTVRKRGRREYISLRISESAAAAVYAEKCGLEPR